MGGRPEESNIPIEEMLTGMNRNERNLRFSELKRNQVEDKEAELLKKRQQEEFQKKEEDLRRQQKQQENGKEIEEDKAEEQERVQQEAIVQQGMELVIYMENALNLKRKWQEEGHPQIKDSKEGNNIQDEVVGSLKKRKGDAKSDKAEEAGLIIAHPKP
ncbi:hypothetical protein PIB30_091799 [Stylosanthes scabra]|uniref:Uncharacterized protein n=1 Tax=Stylosanthes scabra TaxID=79078 RepID=A0ABU6WUR1_9FABA|nr:hypothetical protein [Stylosanthes scabra]